MLYCTNEPVKPVPRDLIPLVKMYILVVAFVAIDLRQVKQTKITEHVF